MKSLEQLLAEVRQGVIAYFLLSSPAQRLQCEQLTTRLIQEGISYRLRIDAGRQAVMVITTPQEVTHDCVS